MFFLFSFFATAVFAQTNTTTTDASLKLLPAYGELPATFGEQHGVAVILSGLTALGIATFIVWWWRRPKPPVVVPAEIQARSALEGLRQRPEDGALLSAVSQILRRYFLAAFKLPPGEPTTTEFCQTLASHAPVGAELSTTVAEFLQQCDEQKFSPMPATAALGAVDTALSLITKAEARRPLAAKPEAPRA